ncbi:hypothetical protein F0562_012056 [Nyssa sinensis]|uniref:Uncharacterized protein n=1 Tax=Nyssa sinensis TaxID=561372 RepID=A0A5J4ZVE6_9ASTE|nr:hypothetical protein F0562_012056 [Nyssa sinensis]
MRTDLTTAGVTGRPNDDWCESHKAETTLTNVVGTLTPAELCREEGLILINYATGHIFEYDSTFVPVMIFGVVSGAGSMSVPPGQPPNPTIRPCMPIPNGFPTMPPPPQGMIPPSAELGTNWNLYALVFGEFVLNDAMAISLYRTMSLVKSHASSGQNFSHGLDIDSSEGLSANCIEEVGCSIGHPAEIILSRVEELKHITTLVAELNENPVQSTWDQPSKLLTLI